MTSSSSSAVCDLFFASKPCLYRHVELLKNEQGVYLQALQTVCDTGVATTLSQPTKAIILAVLHMMGHQKRVQEFLQHCDVVAVVKACQILDRPRKIKQLEQRIALIEKAHPALVTGADEEGPPKKEKKITGKRTFKKQKMNRGRKQPWNEEKTKRGRKQPRNEEGSQRIDEQEKKKRRRRIDVYRAELKRARINLKGSHGYIGGGADCTDAHESSAVREIIESASLSGAFAKKVRRWAGALKSDFLEFILMSNSTGVWKELADLVHFSPGDFGLPYFLSAAHGAALPEDSFVQGMRFLVEAPVGELAVRFGLLAEKHPQVYQAFNFLRMHDHLLQTNEIAVLLAKNCNLSTVIWYLEEIAQSGSSVPDIVADRLKTETWMDDDTSKVAGSFGKLLERIITFRSRGWLGAAEGLKPAARRRLSVLKEKWAVAPATTEGRQEEQQGLTVVFGDKSSSMTSAIQAATIIAAMVAVCFRAELSFFDDKLVPSPHKCPGTVEHVMEIIQTIHANNCTSMAAALWPYYEKKQKISRIILVSDEGENTRCHNFSFAGLLKTYMEEVNHDVELISICVDSGDLGFRQNLVDASIEHKRIEIDGYRPDLSKFDLLLGQIALLSQPATRPAPCAESEISEEAAGTEKTEIVEEAAETEDFVVEEAADTEKIEIAEEAADTEDFVVVDHAENVAS